MVVRLFYLFNHRLKMTFVVSDLVSHSRFVTFTLCDSSSTVLCVKTPRGDLFQLNALYDISVTHQFGQCVDNVYYHGVVTRESRNSIYISTSSTVWIFPKAMCTHRPGMEVWVRVLMPNTTTFK